MAGKILIDTNVAIAYLNDQLPKAVADLLEKQQFCISVISRIELLAWKNATAEKIAILENFVSSVQVYQLEEPVILKAIEIRKSSGIKLPDAIIAATALAYNLTLSTRNISDFKLITGLSINNPWDN